MFRLLGILHIVAAVRRSLPDVEFRIGEGGTVRAEHRPRHEHRFAAVVLCDRRPHRPMADARDVERSEHSALGADTFATPVVDRVHERRDMVGAPFASGVNPPVSAQFSVPYTVSVALLEGRVGLSAFDVPNILGNTRAIALAAKVAVDPFPLTPGQGMYDMPTTLSCTLRNGAKYSLSTDKVKGSPEHPFTAEERLIKLRDCADELLSEAQIESLQATIGNLEADSVGPVMSILRTAGSAASKSYATMPTGCDTRSRIAG
jgi:hypothetical protein